MGEPVILKPVAAPSGAITASFHLDCSAIPNDSDLRHASMAIELSIDGGETWGDGCFVDLSDGQVPLCFSLVHRATAGYYDPKLEEKGIAPYAGFGASLPVPGSKGIWVKQGQEFFLGTEVTITEVLTRLSFVSKEASLPEPVMTFTEGVRAQRQLAKDVHHSVAFDAATEGGAYSNVTSKSWTHTCTGSEGLLIAPINWTALGTSSTASVTHDSVSLTSIGFKTSSVFQDSLGGRAELFGLKAPNTGAKTTAVTWSEGAFGGGSGSESYTGVEQTGAAWGTAATANGTSTAPSVDVASTTSGNYVVDCLSVEFVGGQSGSWSPGTDGTPNHTFRMFGDESGGGVGEEKQCGGAQDFATSGGTATMSWTLPASRRWITVAAEIIASGGGGGAGGPLSFGGALTHGALIRGGRLAAVTREPSKRTYLRAA